MAKQKKLLFRVTRNDVRWDYYKGTGAGGQNKNKTENCVRCTHEPSGAVGKSEEGRSKDLNKRKAFERMANSKEFQAWCKKEAMRRSGELAIIEAKVDAEMTKNTVVEVFEDGKWVEKPDMRPTQQDLDNAKADMERQDRDQQASQVLQDAKKYFF
jgi:protein subunit release factor B